VSNIDLATFTCTCTPINGDAEFFDVLLNADADKGFTLIPKDNSVVIVQQTSQATAYVSMVSKVDQIYLAGDANGGLVKIDDLKLQYDTMIASFKAAISAGFTALSGLDGGASLSAFNSAAASVINLNKTTLENTKVKHGNG
jgi:uncharacterized membrane protein YjjP (DUF1212 family)